MNQTCTEALRAVHSRVCGFAIIWDANPFAEKSKIESKYQRATGRNAEEASFPFFKVSCTDRSSIRV